MAAPSLPLPLPLPHWKSAGPRSPPAAVDGLTSDGPKPVTVAAPVAVAPRGPRPSTTDHPQDNGRTVNDESGKNKIGEKTNHTTNHHVKDNNINKMKDVEDHANRAAFNAAAFNASFYAGTDLT